MAGEGFVVGLAAVEATAPWHPWEGHPWEVEDVSNATDAKDLVTSPAIVHRKADASSARVTATWLANVPLPFT